MRSSSIDTPKLPVDSRLEEHVEKAKRQSFLYEEHQPQRKRNIESLMPSHEKDWIDDDDYDDDGGDEEFE